MLHLALQDPLTHRMLQLERQAGVTIIAGTSNPYINVLRNTIHLVRGSSSYAILTRKHPVADKAMTPDIHVVASIVWHSLRSGGHDEFCQVLVVASKVPDLGVRSTDFCIVLSVLEA